jgi:DNA-binding transcriptional MerR regulator
VARAPDTAGSDPEPGTWTVDELARRAGLPVRTIREYQTMGLLPPPERWGRIGMYRAAHLIRLDLIGRLQHRGYSLAGIRDLLAAWRDGADLGEVLGLAPDQLVHLDEPGVPATLDQLAELVPALVPQRLDDLAATGVIEACGPGRYCVPSPSLLQLSIDALAAGLAPDAVLQLLGQLRAAADTASQAVLEALTRVPTATDAATIDALVTRGRGLLAHGLGRLTLHRLGRRLGAPDHATGVELTELLRNQTRSTRRRRARSRR